ncbi:MAG: hypothetical protein R2867_42505 [Caldilineaceae bacterium]
MRPNDLWVVGLPMVLFRCDPVIGVLSLPVSLASHGAAKHWFFGPARSAHYGRNNWHMRSVDGCWVLDSPVSNATAHYLHNLFFLLRKRPPAPKFEKFMETHQANPLQNCDTAALRCMTMNDVEVLYYTSHAFQTSQVQILH